MTCMTERKRAMREKATKIRDAAAVDNDIGLPLIESFDAALSPPNGLIVSGYHPIGNEANVMPLLKALSGRGHTIALPIVPRRGEPLVFRAWREGDAMDSGPFGIQEPRADAPAVRPDLILAPLLAFDRHGNRLGYGGGFYDRTIRAVRDFQPAMAVGIAYAAQETDSVPHDDGDVALDWIVTEREAIRAAGSGT